MPRSDQQLIEAMVREYDYTRADYEGRPELAQLEAMRAVLALVRKESRSGRA